LVQVLVSQAESVLVLVLVPERAAPRVDPTAAPAPMRVPTSRPGWFRRGRPRLRDCQ